MIPIKSKEQLIEEYNLELVKHNEYMDLKKPKFGDFDTDELFEAAMYEWKFERAVTAPNHPDCEVVNND